MSFLQCSQGKQNQFHLNRFSVELNTDKRKIRGTIQSETNPHLPIPVHPTTYAYQPSDLPHALLTAVKYLVSTSFFK